MLLLTSEIASLKESEQKYGKEIKHENRVHQGHAEIF